MTWFNSKFSLVEWALHVSNLEMITHIILVASHEAYTTP